jgi:uncharacterized protein with HEPN domain
VTVFGSSRNASKSMPEWRDNRGIWNWLRHQYERIKLSTIWKTVQTDLPPLKAAILRATRPPPSNPVGPSRE